MTFRPVNTLAPYLNTSTYFPEDFIQFRIRFLELWRDIANTVNSREIGYFDLQETPTGERWFTTGDPQTKRQTFRKVFEFSDANLNFAHNITGIVLCTHIYGSATNGTNFFPIPYVSATAVTDQIQVDVTPTNIVITKGAGAPPAITNGVIVLEYLKN